MSRESVLFTRAGSIWTSRVVVLVVVSACFASYFVTPRGVTEWTLDVLLRTYLHFVAGAMAHEACHGHLGKTKWANLWWGRGALIPTTVPFVTFRTTHIAHHRYTNIAGDDPDEFLNTPRGWEVPFRAVAMPHHWVMWLWNRGAINRRFLLEYFLSYAVSGAFFLTLALQVGWERVVVGYVPAGILHALLLWYPFAIKTHEGYSTGEEVERSHDYHGKLAYWFSFGLSLHRVHHLKPHLSWLQMYSNIVPCSWWQALTFRRDVQTLPRS